MTFDSLFLGGKGDALPPIDALGLFYDFRDLTPIGRRGDEMIRRLADRLVSVDLLDQAAELLQHQVDQPPAGRRARAGRDPARRHLSDEPQAGPRARDACRRRARRNCRNELRDQRLLLEARALSDIGRHDLALEVIANIESREAIRLRSDILWAAQRWREAAEQIELLYGDRWSEFTPLTETERSDILRAAIGYALGEEPIGLARFRERYAGQDGGQARTAAPSTWSARRSAPAARNSRTSPRRSPAVDTLDSFLRDMRTRYPEIRRSSPQRRAPASRRRRRRHRGGQARRGRDAAEAAGRRAAASRPHADRVDTRR